MEFVPIGKPTSTETIAYEPKPITLAERTNLWGTTIDITKAPSNTYNFFRRWTIRKDNSVFNKK